MAPKNMTANPLKAPRHRPGKAIADSDSSSAPETSEDEAPSESHKSIPPPKFTTSAAITKSLQNVQLEGQQGVAALKELPNQVEQKLLPTHEEGFITESSAESEEDSGNEESSEEESSEEEVPRQVLMRPTFIKKENRNKFPKKITEHENQNDQLSVKQEIKRIAADEIVEEQIKRDLAAKAAGKKHWDDDEEECDIDDTDDIDPEAEYASWKLRELKRIKREREEIEEKEKEREEVERRKNLSVDERAREDNEHIARQREEKEGKSKMFYMQKYYHKGAFYQEEAKTAGLHQRTIMGAKIQDEYDRELLPKYLQQRDLTKIGKKGATKYRDLKTEDTGRWGQYDYNTRRDRHGDSNYDERFKPDDNKSIVGGTGANSVSISLKNRKFIVPGKMEDVNEERVKDNTHEIGGKNQRTQSCSPPRESTNESRRHKRSVSRDTSRYDSDKRRKKDVE